MPLTDAKQRALRPRERPYKIADFDGLYVTVNPTRSRLWHWKCRIGGREKRLAFGPYPSVSLAEARRLRDDARGLLANGIDPGQEKKERKLIERERSGYTFENQARAFIDKQIKEGRAPATLSKNEWLLGMASAEFGSRPMNEITAPIVLRCLRKVEAKGNYETARRLRSKSGAVFRFAVASGVADGMLAIELVGELAGPLALGQDQRQTPRSGTSGRSTTLVAGVGFGFDRTRQMQQTFRLG